MQFTLQCVLTTRFAPILNINPHQSLCYTDGVYYAYAIAAHSNWIRLLSIYLFVRTYVCVRTCSFPDGGQAVSHPRVPARRRSLHTALERGALIAAIQNTILSRARALA